MLTDSDLVQAARGGETAGLGALLARHQAGMRAVALSILGPGPDAEDAVQDAMLVAVRRLDELRDPAAAGPWLRAVVRNNCRMLLRARRPVPVGDLEPFAAAPAGPTPEELLDDRAQRDWIWHALGELSEPVRLVTTLRYFSTVTAYDEIAALCGIPVGTVRSRLHLGRARLAAALTATADLAHDDASARTAGHRRDAEQLLIAARNGDFEQAARELWWPDLEVVLQDGRPVPEKGFDLLVRGMAADLSEGVRQRLRSVVAGPGVLIYEADLVSPADDPGHCPPAVVWLHHLRAGRTSRLRLFHSAVNF